MGKLVKRQAQLEEGIQTGKRHAWRLLNQFSHDEIPASPHLHHNSACGFYFASLVLLINLRVVDVLESKQFSSVYLSSTGREAKL